MSDSAPDREHRSNRVLYPAKTQIPPSDAGRKFGLSDHWHQDYVEAELAARRRPLDEPQALLAAIRASDDPDHHWPAQSLIAALSLPAGPRRALLNRLQDTKTQEVALRELMDAVMLGEGATTVNGHTSGLLVLPGIGEKAFVAIATALTILDMGPRCNGLWYKRVANLKGRWATIPASRPKPPAAS